MKKILCAFIGHLWQYRNETHEFVYTDPRFAMMSAKRSVPLRKCMTCGKSEHHLLPVGHQGRSVIMNWRPWKYKPGAILRQKVARP